MENGSQKRVLGIKGIAIRHCMNLGHQTCALANLAALENLDDCDDCPAIL